MAPAHVVDWLVIAVAPVFAALAYVLWRALR